MSTIISCSDDPIPEGVPTGAVVVQLKTTVNPFLLFDKITLEVDQVQIVHRSSPSDPSTEVIYEVNNEVSNLEVLNEDNLIIIGQYEVPVGSIEQIRYRIRSAKIVINNVFQGLKVPSGEQTGLKFVPAVQPSPFIMHEGDIFAVEGIFKPESLIRRGNGEYLLKPTLPSIYQAINKETGVLGNELVIIAKEGISQDTVKTDVEAYGAYIIPPTYYGFYRIRLSPTTLIQDAYNHFKSLGWVQSVTVSEMLSVEQVMPPGETISAPQNTSNLQQAWQRALNTMGTVGNYLPVVAVIDTGVDLRNRDIAQNLWLNPGEINHLTINDANGDGFITISDIDDPQNSAVSPGDLNGNGYLDGEDILSSVMFANGSDGDGNGYVDDIFGWDFYGNDNNPIGGNFHGTAVAGVIGGANNGQGILGTTHRARIMAIQVFGLGATTSNAIIDAGMQYGQSFNVDIANLSLGSTWRRGGVSETCTNRCADIDSKAWGDSVNERINELSFLNNPSASVLWIISAGNDQGNLDSENIFGGLCEAAKSIIPDRVIITASVDQSLAQSSFTNYGNTLVDIAAPGEDWTLAGLGSGTPFAACSPVCRGTSFSAPMNSGALALMISLNPSLRGHPVTLKQSSLQAAPNGLSGAPVIDGNFLDLDAMLSFLGY